MTAHQHSAFQSLVAAWRRRGDARAHASVADVAAARSGREFARGNVHSGLTSQLR